MYPVEQYEPLQSRHMIRSCPLSGENRDSLETETVHLGVILCICHMDFTIPLAL